MSIDNLSKDNFWNEVEKKYPVAFKHFSKWIDEYKKETNWEELFGNDHKYNHGIAGTKFHDIPFDMQNGILARYELELFNNHGGQGKKAYEFIAENQKVNLRSLFSEVQTKLVQRNKNIN